MNKNGQTLILFVIFIPIFLLLLAFVVDTGIILKEHTKLNSTTKTILKTTIKDLETDEYEEKVRALLEKNKIPIFNLEIKKEEDFVEIKNEYKIESIFGKTIGIKEYRIKCSFRGKVEENTLKIEKE